MKFTFKKLVLLCAITLFSGFVLQTAAQNKRADDAARHANSAAKTFDEIMKIKDKGIPQSLLDKAEAVAVFPDVKKAGFIVGGKGGNGVISRRVKGGWTEPAFYHIGGGSFGLQAGVESTDLVLLIMNNDGVNNLLKDKFEIGGEAGVAAGPVGRDTAASTDATLQAGILSYSRSKGAFAGVALKGSAITPDNDLNEAFYGKKAKDLLTESSPAKLASMPPQVQVFPRTLSGYSVK